MLTHPFLYDSHNYILYMLALSTDILYNSITISYVQGYTMKEVEVRDDRAEDVQ